MVKTTSCGKPKLEEMILRSDQPSIQNLNASGECSFVLIEVVSLTQAPRYHQAHAPIAEQMSVEGHSVRAMYLLTAVADLCRIESDAAPHKLRSAMYTLWDNMTQRKMYVTGGIGAIKQWEGFGQDYFLPQGTDEGGCYAETCASIGVMMLAQRILQVSVEDPRIGAETDTAI